jgi:hypothetical protein
VNNEQLKQLFPNASPSFIKANADRGSPPGPEPEPAICHGPLAEKKRKGGDSSRIHVRVISHRRRLIDPDNLCPKYFIDCLRYAEIIPDDTAACVTVQTEQVKVKSKADERTEILIE